MEGKVLAKGEKVFLRLPCERDVYGMWWQWFNDAEVTRYMNKGEEENTTEKQVAFFRKVNESENDFILAICDINTKKHIGTTGIHNIRTEEDGKVGNFGIVIGEKEYWAKGIGSEAWYLMIGYVFDNLMLDSIETKIFTDNIASLKIAEKLGFKFVGILKRDVIKCGKEIDRVVLRLDKGSWYKNIKAKP